MVGGTAIEITRVCCPSNGVHSQTGIFSLHAVSDNKPSPMPSINNLQLGDNASNGWIHAGNNSHAMKILLLNRLAMATTDKISLTYTTSSQLQLDMPCCHRVMLAFYFHAEKAFTKTDICRKSATVAWREMQQAMNQMLAQQTAHVPYLHRTQVSHHIKRHFTSCQIVRWKKISLSITLIGHRDFADNSNCYYYHYQCYPN